MRSGRGKSVLKISRTIFPVSLKRSYVNPRASFYFFFWAHSACFSFDYDDNSSRATVTSFSGYGEQLKPTVQIETGNNVGFVCKTDLDGCEDGLQEFVAVGRRQMFGIPEDLAEEICPPVILVLQIERNTGFVRGLMLQKLL